MSDVFILGAGFSRAIGPKMPLMRDLAEQVFRRVHLPIAKAFLSAFGSDIEIAMTYLAQEHPWLPEAENLRNRATFLDLAFAVRDVLSDAMQETVRERCPSWLIDLINYWTKNHCHVLTLNYDTLVESAARTCTSIYAAGLWPSMYYPFPMQPADEGRNLFSFEVWEKNPAFTLYKLHGSINWLYSGSPLVPGQTIYHSGLDDLWGGTMQPMPPPRMRHSDKVPLIVPPVADKASYFQHPQLRGMWSDAAMALRQASRIFFLGYSMPKTDRTIQFFLWRNQPERPCKLFLVDVFDRAEHFREVVPGGQLVFDRQHCCPDRPIPRFVERLLS